MPIKDPWCQLKTAMGFGICAKTDRFQLPKCWKEKSVKLEGETSDHLDSIFIISCLKREGSGVQASGPPCPPLPRRPPRQGGPGCVGDKALYLVTRSLITADLRYATMRLNAIPGEIEEERAIDAANFLKVGEKCSAVQGTR